MNRIDNTFQKTLISWYSRAKRDLPWRNTKDPYKIWLSEIILQQTRIEQGLPYYNRFVAHYPTVGELANAHQQEVLKLWEGLGYYSRARNLHATAVHVSNELNGQFPINYSGLLKLKGIGPYTAAAIASFAYEEPVPVIDGNVFRFAARYFGIDKDIADAKNRKYFEETLTQVISQQQPGEFNQAIMEFGATVCTPSKPLCHDCPFASSCHAFAHNQQGVLPVKSKKTKVKELFMHYIIYQYEGQTLMKRRNESIWNGLFEFHSLISETKNETEDILKEVTQAEQGEVEKIVGPIKHLLSHRKLWVNFYHINIKSKSDFEQLAKDLNLAIYSWEEVLTLPRPKVIVNHLQQVVF